MIVDSMTHDEVYLELARDRESVTRWWHHQLEAQRRRALKCERFPLRLWFEYTSTRKNKYLFFTRIFDKKMRSILTGIVALRHTREGISAYTTWLSHQELIAPMVLTPHMFKQYAARGKVEKTGKELVIHYFEHNHHGKDSHNQKVVGRSVRWNGEEHLSCCVPDGVLLGQQYGRLFVVRTFITYDMCTGLQQREFSACKQEILTDREMYEQARRYYKG